jgi:hypothetical protein
VKVVSVPYAEADALMAELALLTKRLEEVNEALRQRKS